MTLTIIKDDYAKGESGLIVGTAVVQDSDIEVRVRLTAEDRDRLIVELNNLNDAEREEEN